MFFNESTRIQPAAGVFPIAGSDERSGELPHFKVEMGKIAAPSRPDRGNLLAAMNVSAGLNQHLFHMPIVRLQVRSNVVLEVSVQDNNDITPARAAFPGEEHFAVGDGVDRIV